MKRYSHIIFALLACAALLLPDEATAVTARQMFLSDTVADIFDLIEHSQRLDLLDYYDNGQEVAAANALRGYSAIDTVADNFMKVQLTEYSDVALWVTDVTAKKPKVVVVKTYELPMPDSDLAVYEADWSLTKNQEKIFARPAVADFLIADNKAERSELEQLEVDEMPFLTYTLNPEDGALTISLNAGEWMSREALTKWETKLRHTLRYRWSGKRYELQR